MVKISKKNKLCEQSPTNSIKLNKNKLCSSSTMKPQTYVAYMQRFFVVFFLFKYSSFIVD